MAVCQTPNVASSAREKYRSVNFDRVLRARILLLRNPLMMDGLPEKPGDTVRPEQCDP